MSYREVSEIRDGMLIDWDMRSRWMMASSCAATSIAGQEGKYPVILTRGRTAVLHFDDLYGEQWRRCAKSIPTCHRLDQQV